MPALSRARSRALLAAAASYTSLFFLLLVETLRGQSVAAPGASIAIWAVGTVVVIGWIGLRSRDRSREALHQMAV